MSKEFENLLKEAEKVKCDGYSLQVSEIMHLAKECNNNFINGSWLLFNIGFVKGMRAEKNRQKREKRKKTIQTA